MTPESLQAYDKIERLLTYLNSINKPADVKPFFTDLRDTLGEDFYDGKTDITVRSVLEAMLDYLVLNDSFYRIEDILEDITSGINDCYESDLKSWFAQPNAQSRVNDYLSCLPVDAPERNDIMRLLMNAQAYVIDSIAFTTLDVALAFIDDLDEE